MSVLVDTPVWSLVLRRRKPDPELSKRLGQLWKQGEAKLLGMVRQELLSGVHDATAFTNLRTQLRVEPDYPVTAEHYEVAAEFFNACRSRGIQGSLVDFLLCAVGTLDDLPIYTTDKDFTLFAKHLPIRLI